jgi:hypothetical protein
MNTVTAQLIIALLPLAEQLVLEGTKLIFTPRKDISPQEQIAALEAIKKLLPDMEKK